MSDLHGKGLFVLFMTDDCVSNYLRRRRRRRKKLCWIRTTSRRTYLEVGVDEHETVFQSGHKNYREERTTTTTTTTTFLLYNWLTYKHATNNNSMTNKERKEYINACSTFILKRIQRNLSLNLNMACLFSGRIWSVLDFNFVMNRISK